jgi:hypothetical protein
MGAGPDDRFASGQSEDTDIEETADQCAEDPDYKIKRPFMHNRLGRKFRLGTLGSLRR